MPRWLDPSATTNYQAWEHHARQRLATDDDASGMVPSRFGWTQFPAHGPGAELLGDIGGRRVVELGCGPGDNLTYLVSRGARGVGVDLSDSQIHRARTRWGSLTPAPEFIVDDARSFLATTQRTFNLCYSVFGAVGLCPPAELFGLIRARLRPGGRLAFSVRHADWTGWRPTSRGCADIGQLVLPDGKEMEVARFEHDTPGWIELLERAGFDVLSMSEVSAPQRTTACCLIVIAARI